MILKRKCIKFIIFLELKVSKKEKSKSEMVKEYGVILSIFCMFFENKDRIKRKVVKGSEIGNRMRGEKYVNLVN